MPPRALPLAAAFALCAIGALPAAAAAITHSVTLQPWTLCSGSDPSGADCTVPDFDAGYLNEIYGQIGIRIDVAPVATLVNFDFALTSGEVDAGPTLEDFRDTLRDMSLLGENAAHFGFTPEIFGATVGLAYRGAPLSPAGIVQGPRSNALRETVILAHELGHVLGASHVEGGAGMEAENPAVTMNLLYPILNPEAGSEEFLPAISDASAAVILASPLLVSAVPLPGGGALLLSGLGLMALRRRAAG